MDQDKPYNLIFMDVQVPTVEIKSDEVMLI